MSYITIEQLAEGPGMLAELAEPFGLAVGLMKATIAESDRSAWTSDEIEDADNAIASIQNTLDRVDAEMHVYLARRGYQLPLSAIQFPVLTTWARNIARYHLQPQRDRNNEETGRIERDYRQAISALQQIADGKLSLGAGDTLMPLTPESVDDGAITLTTEPRMFSRGSMRGL